LIADGGPATFYSGCGGCGGGRIAVATMLSPAQVASIYLFGAFNGMKVSQMSESSDYVGKFSVAGGRAQTTPTYDGADETAVLVVGSNPGTLMLVY
jgi:hypothetical protein